MELDSHTEKSLWESIQIIESRELLNKMRSAMWPEMKEKNRNEDHKKLYDQAYPRHLYPRESISLADFIKSGGNIGGR